MAISTNHIHYVISETILSILFSENSAFEKRIYLGVIMLYKSGFERCVHQKGRHFVCYHGNGGSG